MYKLLKVDRPQLFIVSTVLDRQLGLGISDKKIIPRKTEQTEQMVISDGIPVVPRNRNCRNSVPNPSAEEKTSRNSVPWIKKQKEPLRIPFRTLPRREKTRNSVLWIKNRRSLSEFRSEPFRGRETTQASVLWNKNRGNARNAIPNHSVEEETQNKARILRVHHRIYLSLPPPPPVLNNFFCS